MRRAGVPLVLLALVAAVPAAAQRDRSANRDAAGRLVVGDRAGTVSLFDLATGRRVPLLAGDEPNARPGGRLVALRDPSGFAVVSTLAGRQLARLPAGGTVQPASSPDGAVVAFVAGDGVTVARADGTVLATLPGFSQPAWLRGGGLAVAGSGGVHVTDRAFARPRRVDGGVQGAEHPATSADGRRIAFVQGRTLRVVAPDGRGRRVVWRSPRVLAWPAFSPDGRRLAVQQVDGRRYTTWIVPVDRGRPFRVRTERRVPLRTRGRVSWIR